MREKIVSYDKDKGYIIETREVIEGKVFISTLENLTWLQAKKMIDNARDFYTISNFTGGAF